MRPEELMIGDILEYMGTIVKVYSIGAKICVKEYFAKNTYIVDFDNLLKGLELTPEILKKNGFERVNGEYQDVFYVYDGIELLIGDEFTLFGQCKMPIKYVHQLQQVLRLCNISKEIEI